MLSVRCASQVADKGREDVMDLIERNIYSCICKNDGMLAREIAAELHKERLVINQYLYGSPYMRELCYKDSSFRWHGLIRQSVPHRGLEDFCGYYGMVWEFLETEKMQWLEELKQGCTRIGRNLNNTRGLFHSFLDAYETMRQLFCDLLGVDISNWEIAFELRIKRARYIRIYADVLVIADGYIFSLEFKMKDKIDPAEISQAAKYCEYIEVLAGPDYDVIPALVLTKAHDLYTYAQMEHSTAEIPVCSGDMLFHLFEEYLGLLEQ